MSVFLQQFYNLLYYIFLVVDIGIDDAVPYELSVIVLAHLSLIFPLYLHEPLTAADKSRNIATAVYIKRSASRNVCGSEIIDIPFISVMMNMIILRLKLLMI